MLNNLKKRLSNRTFLLALTGLLYQVISTKYKIAPSEFQLYVDIVTYVLIGGGIYSSFDKK